MFTINKTYNMSMITDLRSDHSVIIQVSDQGGSKVFWHPPSYQTCVFFLLLV